MLIVAGNEIVGAIGIRGALGWEKDEAVARAGLTKVAEQLKQLNRRLERTGRDDWVVSARHRTQRSSCIIPGMFPAEGPAPQLNSFTSVCVISSWDL